MDAYELNVSQAQLLAAAQRTLDLTTRLDAELDGAPLTEKGGMGQQREHSLLSEARQRRQTLARLLQRLRLPAVAAAGAPGAAPPIAVGQDRTNAARKAAHARWSK